MGRMQRVALVLVVLALAVVGCGSDAEPAAERPVTIALDFVPNPVHAPIYMAGDAVTIRKPGTGPDSLKLVTSGTVELGVLDIHDLAIAREAGSDLVAVGALVGKPLAALIAQPQIARPRDLEGRTVGVSGLPSDPATIETEINLIQSHAHLARVVQALALTEDPAFQSTRRTWSSRG